MRQAIAWTVAAAVGGTVGLAMRALDRLDDAIARALEDLSTSEVRARQE